MADKYEGLGDGLIADRPTFIVCRTAQRIEVRGSPHRLTRYMAVFEIYNPYSVLQLSEVLSEFRVVMNERVVYSGRAVISNLVNTGIVVVCEASLNDEGWIDIDLFSPVLQRDRLEADFADFLHETKLVQQVNSDFKVVVADIHILLSDLHRWMEQVELSVRTLMGEARLTAEKEILQRLEEPIIPVILPLMQRFEHQANEIPLEVQPLHRSYIKRQLHPLVLCAPFVYRTYAKPLGYAGDYEMVSMMLRDPYEGGTSFAKLINKLYLEIPPVIAHRNRITYLVEQLKGETERVAAEGKRCRVFNLGCGPAQEVQTFLSAHEASDDADLLLLDFNEETLESTSRNLRQLRQRYRRTTELSFEQRSVHQIIKESGKEGTSFEAGSYDVVYCAGLFDYLSDRICRRLLAIFYDLVAPGGLLIATNVHPSNPWKNWMEFLAEWHLVYRDEKQFLALAPKAAPEEACRVRADATGVNIFLEVRKPRL